MNPIREYARWRVGVWRLRHAHALRLEFVESLTTDNRYWSKRMTKAARKIGTWSRWS